MRKKLLSILVLSILVASALGGCTPVSSTPSTPSTLTILSITKGNVFVMKAGTDSWIEAEVGMSLEAGDVIKTNDFSSAEITFFDGSTIELQAGTEIEVVSLDISADTGSTTITLEQTIGTTISRVTKLLDPASRYEVETPTGVAAVRGSSMLIEILADGSTCVTNLAGEIWFNYNGVELQVPVGGVCIVKYGEQARIIPLGMPGVGGFNDIVTDLAIDKSDSSDPVDPGTNLIYTLQITNNGPFDSTGAVVLDALPSGVSFVSATNGGTYDSDSHAVSWAIGPLAKDASTSVSITVKVNESTPPGIITNVAIVGANEIDNYPANDAAAEDTTINTVNEPPLAEDDATITDEDNSVTVAAPGVLNNDSDPDVGDTLTVTAVNTSGTVGNVTAWGANGSFTYDPNGQFEYLQAGGSTTDSFNYTVSDGNGGTDTATVTITINGVNDAPTSISLDNSSIAENQPPGTVVGDFSTTDSDTGDTFTYSLVSGEGDDDNTSFTIVGSQLQTAASFDYEIKNSYSIRVRTTDSGTLYYEEVFNITVTNVNDPPVAVPDNAITQQGTPVTIYVLNNDFDADGDTLTVVSATNGTNGLVTNNGSNVTYTPALGFNGNDSFTYTISDGNGGTDTATVSVDILPPVVVNVRFPDEGTAYIGYEDLQGGDFDYNDFGMNMFIEEVYVDDCLTEINMEFESVIKLSGGSHDIHILRTLSNSTYYNYTITRNTTAHGTETPAVTNASGQGNFDRILFDTPYYVTSNATVTIHIEITDGCESYNSTPTPPRWDLASIWAYYDPYMNYRTTPQPTPHHIGDWQLAVPPLPTGYNVPYILVIPVTGWQAPGEGTCITVPYPCFDNYYATGSPENWYETQLCN